MVQIRNEVVIKTEGRGPWMELFLLPRTFTHTHTHTHTLLPTPLPAQLPIDGEVTVLHCYNLFSVCKEIFSLWITPGY